jgi:serine/threonine protein kinase
MADVYRARDELLGRDVALKVFRRELATEDDLRRQQSEIRLLATLSHPSLVTLFDAVPGADGRGVLVLEFVDGPDLGSRLHAGLEPTALAAIGADVARALDYIHHRGVVHRDVAPANILLPAAERSGVGAKLTDLGIARLVDDAKVTGTGMVVGTAGYMSPEQVRGDAVGDATDVYSLGLVLLEGLTGRREFPGSAVESAAARLSRDPVVPEHLHAEWRELLRAMTAREAADRPSAETVAERLDGLRREPAAASAPLATGDLTRRLPAAPSVPSAGPKRSGRILRAVLIAGIVVMSAALVLVVTVLVRVVTADPPATAPTPTVSYPAVSGQVGDDLTRLEHAVDPGRTP